MLLATKDGQWAECCVWSGLSLRSLQAAHCWGRRAVATWRAPAAGDERGGVTLPLVATLRHHHNKHDHPQGAGGRGHWEAGEPHRVPVYCGCGECGLVCQVGLVVMKQRQGKLSSG